MNQEEETDFALRVCELVEQIKPILAGNPPEMQSAVLADLLSTWVCGFVLLGDQARTKQAREWALATHLGLVKDLLDAGVNEPRGGKN